MQTSDTPQSIAVMVLGSPHGSPHAQTALHYCQAAITQGHSLYRLFFYHEAAYLGNTLNAGPQDEVALPQAWQDFIAAHNLDAVVCIASGLKRGVIDDSEAKRYEKPSSNLSPSMALSGLGQWVDAVCNADQHIIFGR